MKRARIVWLVVLAILLAYEAYAVLNSAPGDTLSEAVWQYGRHPMVTFAVGVLCGHWFWQRNDTPPTPPSPSLTSPQS